MAVRITLDPDHPDLAADERRVSRLLQAGARTYCGACSSQVFWTWNTGPKPDEGSCPMCGRMWNGYLYPGHTRPSVAEQAMLFAADADDASEILGALRNRPGA